VHPDLGGVYAGVTTVVDAGSSGCATFRGFPRHIMPQCHTEIIPFLHICQTGLATSPDIIAEGSIDLEGTLRVADQYKGLICGIKARMVSPALEVLVWRCHGWRSAPPRKWHQADGPYRRYGEALQSDGDSIVAASAG